MASDDNYMVFRECLSSTIVSRSEHKPKASKRRPKTKRNERREVTETDPSLPERADPEELAEFIDVKTTSSSHAKSGSQQTNASITSLSQPKSSPHSQTTSKPSPTPQPNTTRISQPSTWPQTPTLH